MNICILFILFNGSAYVTPGCYTTGVMLAPQDVVYLQHLPHPYINIVYNAPRHYYHSHHRSSRYVRRWRSYRYNHNHYRPQPRVDRRRHVRPPPRQHNVRHRNTRIRNGQPRLKRRVIRRHYNRRGKLKRRTTTRRYY